MESLAYAHLVLAFESPEPPVFQRADGLNWKKLSSKAFFSLLSIAMISSVLSAAAITQAADLGFGSSGTEVALVQKRLQTLGYLGPVRIYGKFRELTKSALIRFQYDRGLRADGIVGPSTRAALFGTPHAGGGGVKKTLAFGSRGSEVTRVQKRLQALGYLGAVYKYGSFRELTRDAVKRFQRDRGLRADGVVGANTRAALF